MFALICLKTLSRIELDRIDVFALEGILNFLMFAGGYDLVAVAILHAYCLECGRVALHLVAVRILTPKGGFHIRGHGLWHAMFDVSREGSRVNINQILTFAMLIYDRALPCSMSDVMNLLSTMHAFAL